MIDDFPLLPTLILENKFSRSELDFINQEVEKDSKIMPSLHTWPGPNQGKTVSNRYFWEWQKHKDISELINRALPSSIASNMLVPAPFILDSFIPYEIHNDYGWFGTRFELLEDETPFYLIIIPILTCEAKTIILNEYGHYVHFVDYKKDHDPLPINEQMSETEYQKYFSHCWPQERPYISIKDIFTWTAGSLLACDIRYFHASDDFLKNEVSEKRCITLMTKIKKDSFLTAFKELSE
jgi:hypothetical protein